MLGGRCDVLNNEYSAINEILAHFTHSLITNVVFLCTLIHVLLFINKLKGIHIYIVALFFSFMHHWQKAGTRSAIGSASDSSARGPGFDTRSGDILSFLLLLIQEGQLSVTGESVWYWLTAKPAQEKCD